MTDLPRQGCHLGVWLQSLCEGCKLDNELHQSNGPFSVLSWITQAFKKAAQSPLAWLSVMVTMPWRGSQGPKPVQEMEIGTAHTCPPLWLNVRLRTVNIITTSSKNVNKLNPKSVLQYPIHPWLTGLINTWWTSKIKVATKGKKIYRMPWEK